MDRRTFLATAGVALAGTEVATAAPSPARPPIRLYSPASQLAVDGMPLTDDSIVAAWAEPIVYNRDASRGDSVRYEGRTPLVSVDDRVAGIGSMFVADPARRGVGTRPTPTRTAGHYSRCGHARRGRARPLGRLPRAVLVARHVRAF